LITIKAGGKLQENKSAEVERFFYLVRKKVIQIFQKTFRFKIKKNLIRIHLNLNEKFYLLNLKY
jgi:hypothetical protein